MTALNFKTHRPSTSNVPQTSIPIDSRSRLKRSSLSNRQVVFSNKLLNAVALRDCQKYALPVYRLGGTSVERQAASKN